ncbi:MAG: hypothetical protein HY823_03895 [Acidobacteria bacterium]|nr:hypothetical protein [Acidobacteriota bacterium]
MRHWDRFLQTTLSAALLGLLAACGGGGSTIGGGTGSPGGNNPPTVTEVSYAPADNPLVRFKSYSFAAKASDPDIGDTISKFEWDFGDGTPTVQTTTGAVQHTFIQSSSEGLPVQIRAYDNKGLAGSWALARIAVDNSPSPITVAFLNPPGPTTLQADPGGGVQITVLLQVSTTSAGTIGLAGIAFNPGEASAQVVNSSDQGGGVFAYTVRYTGAGTQGTRVVTPTARATDSQGISSDLTTGPTITITTLSISNRAPVVVVTNPATPTSSGYTSKPVTLAFTVTDPDNDVVNVTVNWGDGTAPTVSTVSGNTAQGVSLSITHNFPDSFTSTTRDATVTINASDGRSNNGAAQTQTRTFTISFNAYPTATINSPQASGTLPTTTDLPSNPGLGLLNPPGPNDPDIVVIPSGGKVLFAGANTPAGSQDANQGVSWTFQGGIPNASALGNPGEVLFPGTPGAIVAYLVELKATDAFGRTSDKAPGVNPKTFRKWIVVDGRNTQQFKLTFMYRQKSDNNGTSSLSPARTADNGLGATIQLFQDGLTNSYKVEDGSRTKAQVGIPVRANLPFYIRIPAFASTDTRNYLMRIPNSPTGNFADPLLGSTVIPNASSFGFENSSAPFNPVLQIVTGQGFAAETAPSPERRLQGAVDITWGNVPPNYRFLDRLSVPLNSTDSFGALNQWVQSSTWVGGFSGVRAQQQIAEWAVVVGNRITDDTKNAAGGPLQMRFTLDYPKYAGDSQVSETFAHEFLQAFRVPPGVTDPFDLNVAGWTGLNCYAALNPTLLPPTFNAFVMNSIYGEQGGTAFSGGLTGIPIPYDANDPDRKPYVTGRSYGFDGLRKVFGFAEYLWSSVWARPLILNVSNPNYKDSGFGLASFPYFRSSRPSAWPAASGIVPDNSAFDLTVSGGGTFDASSPVAVGGATPSSKGVGRFYWTAFTPSYTSGTGAAISRTWLSDPDGLPPMAITGGPGDATAAFGFLPPQDTMVDKRGRKADGSLDGNSLGGYRVTWFNPTLDSSGEPVPPDFWVVEFGVVDAGVFHFLLPPSFPAGSQKVSDLILTDARTFLPSGRAPSQGPAPDLSDKVAPGYCWFDVPPELRPSTMFPDKSSYLRVFAVKSILKNNAPAGARALNRPDWMDAIKTALPEINFNSTSGETSYAHKIPFNFFWDIVVVNGGLTPVAP